MKILFAAAQVNKLSICNSACWSETQLLIHTQSLPQTVSDTHGGPAACVSRAFGSTFTHSHVHLQACTREHTHTYVHVHTTNMQAPAHMYAHMYTSVSSYTRTHVYVHQSMCDIHVVHAHVYTYHRCVHTPAHNACAHTMNGVSSYTRM